MGSSGGKKNTYGGKAYTSKRYYAGGGNGLRTGGLIGQEVKFLDLAAAHTLPIAGSTVLSNCSPLQSNYNGAPSDTAFGHLTPIPMGSGPNDRNGRACVLKRITIKALLQVPQQKMAANTLAKTHVVRVMMVKDTQTNNSSAITDIRAGGILLASPTDGPTVCSFRDLESQSRFKVLYDRTFIMRSNVIGLDASNSATNAPGITVPFTIDKSFRLPLLFKTGVLSASDQPTDVTTGLMETNSISLFAFESQDADAGTIAHDAEDRVTIRYSARIRWVG